MCGELASGPLSLRRRAYGTRSSRRVEVEELVAAVQNADPAAVERILERFHPLLRWQQHALYTTLREGLHNLHWEDIESQVTLMFLARVRSYRPRRSEDFGHYINRTLEHDCLHWLRRLRRGEAESNAQESSETDGDSQRWVRVSREVSRQEAREVELAVSLHGALDLLEARQREVVWECCVMGRDLQGVAERQGLSPAAVRGFLELGLAQLRRHYETAVPEEQPPNNGPRGRDGRGNGGKGHGGRGVREAMERAPAPNLMKELVDMAKDRSHLVGMAVSRPVTLQGTFPFDATGLTTPQLLSPKLRYVVQPGCVMGIRFVRAGVICPSMVCLSTVVNGLPQRLIPVAPNSTANVPLAIVEPLPAGSEIEIHIASSDPGTIILDVGCLQMPA